MPSPCPVYLLLALLAGGPAHAEDPPDERTDPAVVGPYRSGPVEVLPEWMQWIAKISPATYALRGCRDSILLGTGLRWDDVWPLLVIGFFSIPMGLLVFRAGERYAKQHGKLKRSG